MVQPNMPYKQPRNKPSRSEGLGQDCPPLVGMLSSKVIKSSFENLGRVKRIDEASMHCLLGKSNDRIDTHAFSLGACADQHSAAY